MRQRVLTAVAAVALVATADALVAQPPALPEPSARPGPPSPPRPREMPDPWMLPPRPLPPRGAMPRGQAPPPAVAPTIASTVVWGRPATPAGAAMGDTIAIRGAGLATVTDVQMRMATFAGPPWNTIGADEPARIVGRSDTLLLVLLPFGGRAPSYPFLFRVANAAGAAQSTTPIFVAPTRVERRIESVAGTVAPGIVSPLAVARFGGRNLAEVRGHLATPTALFIGSAPPGTAANPPIPVVPTNNPDVIVLVPPDDCDREGPVVVGAPPLVGQGPLVLSAPSPMRIACVPRRASAAIEGGTVTVPLGTTFVLRGTGLRTVTALQPYGTAVPAVPLPFRFVPGPDGVGGALEVTVPATAGGGRDFFLNVVTSTGGTVTASGRVLVPAAP